MVTEARGKLSLGLLSTGVGLLGLLSSLFLWRDTAGSVRILGSASRNLAEIGGATALFSGISLLQEVGLRLHFTGVLKKVHPSLLLAVATLSVFAVVLALVSYFATVTINFI